MPCTCSRCRNFFAFRDSRGVFPAEVSSVFERLGINERGESELLCTDKSNSDRFTYVGWLTFVGRITAGASADEERITNDFAINFTEEVMFAPDLFGRTNVVEAVFTATIPWVLDEPPDLEPSHPQDGGVLKA